jgi:DNA-binding CsgD family transcriptional regulator
VGQAPAAEAHAILAAIRELPLAYRETLILRLVEGMTGPEIAARIGLTPESVRVNLYRGMKMLRERLDEAPLLPQPPRAWRLRQQWWSSPGRVGRASPRRRPRRAGS